MTPHDRHPDASHEPLAPDERELARVLRALPGHEPPPALDTRILKAAQDAVAATPKRRSRWLLAGSSWGLGTAAAAVLTVGVSWQLLQPKPLPTMPEATAPAASAPAVEEQRLSVELLRREPRAFNTPPPPDDAASQRAERKAREQRQRAEQAERAVRREVTRPAPVAMAPPEAFSDEHVDLPAPASPASAAAPAAGLAKLGSADVAQPQRRDTVDSATLQRIKSDQRLSVDAWLRRIERRADEGDLEGARASLALLQERHPGVRVPAVLQERLRE